MTFLLTDQVHKLHNLAAILRTCDAAGIAEVYLAQPELDESEQLIEPGVWYAESRTHLGSNKYESGTDRTFTSAETGAD